MVLKCAIILLVGIVKVEKKLTKKAFNEVKKDYKTYIKITTDITIGKALLGGEYHADAEKILLDEGSRQEDIWGGGFNLESKNFDTNAIINLRRGNDSTEILDSIARKKFLAVSKKIFKDYVGQK